MINIVEPTLATAAGHCSSFINSLINASTGNVLFRLWASRSATVSFNKPYVELHKYFYRRLRRLQSYFLYQKLLKSGQKIFISTAGRTDLLLLNWAARGPIPFGQVFLYFHWFNPSPQKVLSLKKMAIKQPNLTILGPTPSVVSIFKEAGFINARVVPYPITPRIREELSDLQRFRYLLYAGAARQDKGFKYLVDLIKYFYIVKLDIPVTIQTSAEHLGKCDAETLADIERLKSISYPYLTMLTEVLSVEEYENLYSGAIVMQLYDKNDFTDRISGVTLDALSAGCPVISTSGTWIARMVERFEAGIVLENLSPEAVLKSVEVIMADYPTYNANANRAGQTLQQENSADALYLELTG
jgi:glycosyltransferase involved in cell wall biosynthesis